MAWGRCAGCGYSSASSRKVNTHISGCPDYVLLYQQYPEKALSPEADYIRWEQEGGEEQSKLARSEARARRSEAHQLVNDRQLERERQRWGQDHNGSQEARPVAVPHDGSVWGSKYPVEVDLADISDPGARVAVEWCLGVLSHV